MLNCLARKNTNLMILFAHVLPFAAWTLNRVSCLTFLDIFYSFYFKSCIHHQPPLHSPHRLRILRPRHNRRQRNLILSVHLYIFTLFILLFTILILFIFIRFTVPVCVLNVARTRTTFDRPTFSAEFKGNAICVGMFINLLTQLAIRVVCT